MPAPGGRRGRRDNGLVAAGYEAAGDVDPRIGEHLLDVLAAGGIAAYLQPSTDLHPITRTTSLPATPTDRLFVDRDHLGTAHEYLDQVSAEGRRGEPRRDAEPGRVRPTNGGVDQADEPEIDAAWREIVAGFERDATDPRRGRSEEITLGEPRFLPHIDPVDSRWEAAADPRSARQPDPAEPSLLDGLDTFGATLPADDDEGYTPPPAPPLPRLSAPAAIGIAAIVFGLLLFVWPGLLPLDPDAVLVIAFGSVVAGFGALIWRLRPGDDDDIDDVDDGARV